MFMWQTESTTIPNTTLEGYCDVTCPTLRFCCKFLQTHESADISNIPKKSVRISWRLKLSSTKQQTPCICICVCNYTCMYVCMHILIYAYMYTCIYVSMYVYMYIWTYRYIHICIYVSFLYVYMHILAGCPCIDMHGPGAR